MIDMMIDNITYPEGIPRTFFSVINQIGNRTTMVNESINHNHVVVPEKSYIRVFFLVCYSMLFFMGVIGNLAVLFVSVWRVCVKKRQMRHHNVMIVSLAVADLIGSFFAPLTNIMILGGGSWETIAIGCNVIPSMNFLASIASAWNVVVIALSRLRYFSYV